MWKKNQMAYILWYDTAGDSLPFIEILKDVAVYKLASIIELWHHTHDIIIDRQVIKLHSWLLDNVLFDLAHIES